MSTIQITQGDTYPPLRATLSDSVGPIDLTGATVTLVIRPRLSSGGPVVGGACAITPPASSGVVTYDWQTGDTDTPGEYLAEWHVLSGTDQWTVPSSGSLTLTIRPQLAGIVAPP